MVPYPAKHRAGFRCVRQYFMLKEPDTLRTPSEMSNLFIYSTLFTVNCSKTKIVSNSGVDDARCLIYLSIYLSLSLSLCCLCVLCVWGVADRLLAWAHGRPLVLECRKSNELVRLWVYAAGMPCSGGGTMLSVSSNTIFWVDKLWWHRLIYQILNTSANRS